MASESRTPPPGRWQRRCTRFGPGKRDRERAAISMLSFAMHLTGKFDGTARAAAIVNDVPVLTRLAP